MPAKKDAATELAGKMLEALQRQRERGGEGYPPTLRRLAELADPEAPAALLEKVQGKKAFSDHAMAATKGPESPVALVEDVGLLAASPLVLEHVLEVLGPPPSPGWPLSKLKGQVNTRLRQPFEEAAARQVREGSLPPGVGHSLVRGKPYLFLTRLPPPPPPRKPEEDLADKLVRVLEAQRRLGGDSYPLGLNRLVELTEAQASAPLLKKAKGTPPFSDRVLVAHKTREDAPVALREDLEQLADSPLLLRFALRSACSEAKPAATIAQLKGQVVPPLREAFAAAVGRRVEAGSLPAEVEWLPKKKALHPLWIPLPKAPEVELAEQMVRVLEERRRQGDAAYPARLREVAGRTGIEAGARLLAEAQASDLFRERVVPLLQKTADPPLAFSEDLDRLAGAPQVLEWALEASRSDSTELFAVPDLKKKLHPRLGTSFEEAVARRVEEQDLPPLVGWLGLKGKRYLFLLGDVHTGRQGPAFAAERPPAPADGASRQAPAVDFGRAFDEVFERLDRQGGSHNFVSLVDLRRALPVARAAFDAGLRELRVAGRYTLSAAEGRHGISPEERAAGIPEEGTLLLFVSRRGP